MLNSVAGSQDFIIASSDYSLRAPFRAHLHFTEEASVATEVRSSRDSS